MTDDEKAVLTNYIKEVYRVFSEYVIPKYHECENGLTEFLNMAYDEYVRELNDGKR